MIGDRSPRRKTPTPTHDTTTQHTTTQHFRVQARYVQPLIHLPATTMWSAPLVATESVCALAVQAAHWNTARPTHDRNTGNAPTRLLRMHTLE